MRHGLLMFDNIFHLTYINCLEKIIISNSSCILLSHPTISHIYLYLTNYICIDQIGYYLKVFQQLSSKLWSMIFMWNGRQCMRQNGYHNACLLFVLLSYVIAIYHHLLFFSSYHTAWIFLVKIHIQSNIVIDL